MRVMAQSCQLCLDGIASAMGAISHLNVCIANGEIPAFEPEHDRAVAWHVSGDALLQQEMNKLARICNVRNATRQG